MVVPITRGDDVLGIIHRKELFAYASKVLMEDKIQ
jgi:hypothetical protein